MRFHTKNNDVPFVNLPMGRMLRMVIRQTYRRNRHYPEGVIDKAYGLDNVRAHKDSRDYGRDAAAGHVHDILIALTAHKLDERFNPPVSGVMVVAVNADAMDLLTPDEDERYDDEFPPFGTSWN